MLSTEFKVSTVHDCTSNYTFTSVLDYVIHDVCMCVYAVANMTPIAPSEPLVISLVNVTTGDYSVQSEEGAPVEGSSLTTFIYKITKDNEHRYLFKV